MWWYQCDFCGYWYFYPRCCCPQNCCLQNCCLQNCYAQNCCSQNCCPQKCYPQNSNKCNNWAFLNNDSCTENSCSDSNNSNNSSNSKTSNDSNDSKNSNETFYTEDRNKDKTDHEANPWPESSISLLDKSFSKPVPYGKQKRYEPIHERSVELLRRASQFDILN